MPDITMCQSKTCPSRTTCYRFLATPSLFGQSYVDFDIDRDFNPKCDDYIECDLKDQFKRMDR